MTLSAWKCILDHCFKPTNGDILTIRPNFVPIRSEADARCCPLWCGGFLP